MIMEKYRLKCKIINYAYVPNTEDRLKPEDGKKHLIPPMECSNLHWVDYYGIPEWLLNEDKYFEPVENRIELVTEADDLPAFTFERKDGKEITARQIKLMEIALNLSKDLQDAILGGKIFGKYELNKLF